MESKKNMMDIGKKEYKMGIYDIGTIVYERYIMGNG